MPADELTSFDAFDLRKRFRFDAEKVHHEVVTQTDAMRQALFCLPAGETLPEHVASCAIAVLVLDGEGRFHAEGRATDLRPGVLAQVPAERPHAVEAASDVALLVTFAAPEPDLRFS